MRAHLPSETPVEIVRPPSGSSTAGLVIAPDIGGLRPLFDELGARISREQHWTVCVVEPWPGQEDEPLDWRLDHVGDLHDDRVVGDLVAAADLLGEEKVSIIGFCMGGMYTLKAAGTGRFDRAAAFYGMIRIPARWRSAHQGEPLDALAQPACCPTMAIVGTDDIWTPPADVDDLESAGVEVVRYQGAEHGFVHDPSRASHRPADAVDAWSRVLTFLTRD